MCRLTQQQSMIRVATLLESVFHHFEFTAADVVAPILSSASPTDNATGVAAGANIVLTFNENGQWRGNITLKVIR